jgi:chromatin assembly factor 1 subunit B
VWALATNTSIALYDSQHATAFSYIDNIHYNSLTDIQWSSDGRVLLIASLEGYCSFLLFNEEEIGVPLVELPLPPPSPQLIVNSSKKTPRRVKTAKATTPPPQRTPASASNGGLLRYLMKTPTTEKAETGER